jgi:adenylate kinase family enzyme
MSDYDFTTLNDKEFEILCADLLSVSEGKRFERFKPGKDAGVDGRYFAENGTEVILQCKHWMSSPLERLVNHLKVVELPKIALLAPDRYLLAVSHQLSRADKTAIATTLAPYVLRDDDVFGRADLNDLLAKSPTIERRHYKLWIRSTAVLQYLLNKPIQDRSNFALEDIMSEAKLYVQTANHLASLEKLESLGTVIITGAPGIGKTTLANHLVLHYVEKGFKLVQIADEIREAEGVHDPDLEQIFYFDDFLGRNYLEALTGHEGSHIVQFIKRMARDRKKRFILTSRTTILNQGKALIDVFSQNNLNRNEFEITIDSLSDLDKAHILYNHIWHTDLTPEYVDQLYENRRYRQVISHRNFNPRLVRFVTDANALADCEPANYWSYTRSLLDNPAKVWEHPFEAQLDDFGRSIVLLVAINGRPIHQTELAEAFARMVARAESSGYTGRRDFLLALRHLAGSMLNRRTYDPCRLDQTTLDLFNPSVGDFVLHRYVTDIPALRAAFCSLRSESSIGTLTALISEGKLALPTATLLIDDVLANAKNLHFVSFHPEYISYVCMLRVNAEPASAATSPALARCVEFVTNSDCPRMFVEVAKLIRWALSIGIVPPEIAEQFVATACTNTPYAEELELLAAIALLLGSDAQDRLADAYNDATLDYLTSSVHDEFDDSAVFNGVEYGDLASARRRLKELVEEKMDKLGAKASVQAIEEVIDAYDIDSRAERYFADQEPDEDWREHRFSSPPVDEIDDLFDRS